MPINPIVGAQLIGSGAGIVTNALGGIFQDIQGNRQQHREMEYNERMIDKQNAYNSPANQMRLLKEAGLNPNAILGGNTLSGAIQSSAPSAPEAKKAQWDMIGGEIANLTQDAALKAAQVESIRHETERQDDVHQQEYGENGYKSKYFELSSTNAAAQRVLWGANVRQADAIIRNIDDEIWNRSFMRMEASLNNYIGRRETQQRMEIAAKGEERAQRLFPLTLAKVRSEIGQNNAMANYFVKNAAYLGTQNEFFRRSNLMDFVDGVDSLGGLGIPEKRALLEMKLTYNRMLLEGYRGTTEQHNWNLIDSRIGYYGKLGNLLDLRSQWQQTENYNKWFELFENRLRFGMDALNTLDKHVNSNMQGVSDFYNTFRGSGTRSFSRPWRGGTFSDSRPYSTWRF